MIDKLLQSENTLSWLQVTTAQTVCVLLVSSNSVTWSAEFYTHFRSLAHHARNQAFLLCFSSPSENPDFNLQVCA